jgi:hypothetical protein
MRHRILLLVVASAVFGSCTTMYKSGQTPDDVYFSPGREVPAYVETKNNPEENARQSEDFSDAYLRMKTYDRNRWSAFDNDYMYWNDWRWNNQMYYNSFRPYPYSNWGVGYNTGWYSGWTIGYSMNFGYPYNGYYSPFCPGYYGSPVVIINPKAYTPRSANLNTYRTNPKTNSFADPKTGARTYNISSPTSAPLRTFRSGGTNAGSSSRGYYYNNSSSKPRYQEGSTSPTRSFNQSTNSGNNTNSSGTRSSSGSSGSSGGSAPVRSFPRGGG